MNKIALVVGLIAATGISALVGCGFFAKPAKPSVLRARGLGVVGGRGIPAISSGAGGGGGAGSGRSGSCAQRSDELGKMAAKILGKTTESVQSEGMK
jgi:hypothetical protein